MVVVVVFVVISSMTRDLCLSFFLSVCSCFFYRLNHVLFLRYSGKNSALFPLSPSPFPFSPLAASAADCLFFFVRLLIKNNTWGRRQPKKKAGESRPCCPCQPASQPHMQYIKTWINKGEGKRRRHGRCASKQVKKAFIFFVSYHNPRFICSFFSL